MTLEEVAERLGKSPNTIEKNFKRTQTNLAKQGVSLIRRGPNDYDIAIIDKSKAYFTISQLIGALEDWKEELGDIPVYRMNGNQNHLVPTYRVFNIESKTILGATEGYDRVIVID